MLLHIGSDQVYGFWLLQAKTVLVEELIAMKQFCFTRVVAFTIGLVLALPAHAVIVDIDIETEGEPVPGASISFRTPGGKGLPDIQVTAVPEDDEDTEEDVPDRVVVVDIPTTGEDEDKPQRGRPEKDSDPKREAGNDESAKPKPGRYRVDIPDDLVGRELVVVVSKGDELVKRDPIKVERDTSHIAVEAYDPIDARLSIKLAQAGKCRLRKTCNYQLEVENEGTGIYKGPLFLTGVLHGTVSSSGNDDGWHCAYSGRGKQICHNQVSLQPGDMQSWTLASRLPRRLPRRASNCLEIDVFGQQATGRVEPLLMAVQLGLAGQGVEAGRPDGIMGPRTAAALRQFTSQDGYEGSDDLSDVFKALYGLSPARLSRLGISGRKHCQRVALISVPKPAKRTSKTRRRRPRAHDDGDFDDYDDYDDDYDYYPRADIGIGLGLLNNRFHRGRRYDRQRGRRHERRNRRERRDRGQRRQQLDDY